ncbi:PREDICTED: uncharacterized protein LOC18612374 [Theobroma cacao]|uniref:Uncharacterized protein LOC18612374 n=1 Tax=Theobroma cacao TaxID=3641 RepID=A0AB32W0Y0_THECC|nr:PREDICTED: uncharacterized protein LOC18612374 [Theobroma cacao]
MKKLYSKGKVHPSPPPPPPTITDHLSLLPTTILSLTTALSLEDKEVLAYLISCCSFYATNNNNFPNHRGTTSKSIIDVGGDNKEHDPMFKCNCFGCYMCFWARWDTSPNRQLIHEIIEAYEEGLFQEKKQGKKNKKGKRKRICIPDAKHGNDQGSSGKRLVNLNEQLKFVEMNCRGGEEGEVKFERGSIRKIVSFIEHSIWGVWNRN